MFLFISFFMMFVFFLTGMIGLIIGSEIIYEFTNTIPDKKNDDDHDDNHDDKKEGLYSFLKNKESEFLTKGVSAFCGIDEINKEGNESGVQSYIKNKESEITSLTTTLQQRNILNKPDKTELNDLKTKCTHITEVCNNIDFISNELSANNNKKNALDTQNLQKLNNILQITIQKWEKILLKEDAIDQILENSNTENSNTENQTHSHDYNDITYLKKQM